MPYRDDFDDQGGNRENAPRRRRRSAGRRLLRFVFLLLVLAALAAGGLFAASRYGLIESEAVDRVIGRIIDIVGLPVAVAPAPPPSAPAADVIFAGEVDRLATAPGNTVQADPSTAPPVVWFRSSVKSASPEGATEGVSVVVPPALLPRLEGRRVRVTISAQSGSAGDPVPFAAAYSAGARGTSGWLVFVPEKRFTEHSFTYAVPIGEIGGANEHRIAIWSDIEGRQVPLAVRSIAIRPE